MATKHVSLKVFMGNLDSSNYVLMAAKTEQQFLECTCCLKAHSFGQVHSVAFIQAALSKPGVPLIRKIHNVNDPWRDMTVVLPARGARRLAPEEI